MGFGCVPSMTLKPSSCVEGRGDYDVLQAAKKQLRAL